MVWGTTDLKVVLEVARAFMYDLGLVVERVDHATVGLAEGDRVDDVRDVDRLPLAEDCHEHLGGGEVVR